MPSRAPALVDLHPSRPKTPASIVMQVCFMAGKPDQKSDQKLIKWPGLHRLHRLQHIHFQRSSGQCRNGIIQFERQTPKRSDERPCRGRTETVTEMHHRCHSLFPHLALPHPNQLRIGMNKCQPQWPEASPEDATCSYMFTNSKLGIRKER